LRERPNLDPRSIARAREVEHELQRLFGPQLRRVVFQAGTDIVITRRSFRMLRERLAEYGGSRKTR
jgi:hypothetical protein